MAPSKTTSNPFNPTTETYYTRGCDRRIRSAAFVQDSTVTTEERSGYTLEMLGLEKYEFLCKDVIHRTHNRRATLGNKLGMWVLDQGVSMTHKQGSRERTILRGRWRGRRGRRIFRRSRSHQCRGWDGGSARVCTSNAIGNMLTHMLRIEENEEKWSAMSKFACLESLLGESRNISHVRQCDSVEIHCTHSVEKLD